MACELVANAVRASARGQTPVGLRLTADGGRVLIEMQDRNPEPPQPQAAGYLDEGGRGLRVVAGLTRRWGHYFAGWPDSRRRGRGEPASAPAAG